MHSNQKEKTCQQCGATASGNFCSNCGQSLSTKRLTVSHIGHEIFHFFTHLDKGFAYTLKKLALQPGKMQKEYIDGQRGRHQKPFSMFFICASVLAFAIYIIHKPTTNSTHFDQVQGDFTRHYYVLHQTVLLPLYAFGTWLLFRNNKINYAECLILFVYTLSFMFLLVIFTNLADLIPNKHFLSAYYEIPILLGYLLWTNFNFFTAEPKWRLVLKTIINIIIGSFISRYTAFLIINWMM